MPDPAAEGSVASTPAREVAGGNGGGGAGGGGGRQHKKKGEGGVPFYLDDGTIIRYTPTQPEDVALDRGGHLLRLPLLQPEDCEKLLGLTAKFDDWDALTDSVDRKPEQQHNIFDYAKVALRNDPAQSCRPYLPYCSVPRPVAALLTGHQRWPVIPLLHGGERARAAAHPREASWPQKPPPALGVPKKVCSELERGKCVTGNR